MRQHETSASLLAHVLNEHEFVRRVYYPGLRSHAGHEIARQQQAGFGGMVSFEIAGGEHAVRAFLESLELFSLAESLGGVESLVCHPASMTHAPLNEQALHEAGISKNLVRLSVGLECSDDLIADVISALEVARTASRFPPLSAVAE
jgi:cystathionine gamma-synthase